MKKSKSMLLVLFSLLIFSSILICDKRVKPKDMKEFTDPKSPSYVPIPYPKNKKELLENLKYWFLEVCNAEGVKSANIDNKPYVGDLILLDLCKPNSTYKIESIWKVENRMDRMPDNFFWYLIITRKNDGKVVLRVTMAESGLVKGGTPCHDSMLENTDREGRELILRDQIKFDRKKVRDIIKKCDEPGFSKKTIKKIERVAFASGMCNFMNPFWEIVMTDGTTYYYDQLKNIFYGIENTIPWKKQRNGFRPFWADVVPHRLFMADEYGDRFIVLRQIPLATQ